MSSKTFKITLQENQKGTFFCRFKDDKGQVNTAYVGKPALLDNKLYVKPTVGIQYIAVISTSNKKTYYINQLLPADTSLMKQRPEVSVLTNDSGITLLDVNNDKKLITLSNNKDPNYALLWSQLPSNELIKAHLIFNENKSRDPIELKIDPFIKVEHKGSLVKLTEQQGISKKFIEATFESDSKQPIHLSFPSFHISFLESIPQKIPDDVVAYFDEEKHSVKVSFTQLFERLVKDINETEQTFTYVAPPSKDTAPYVFLIKYAGMRFKAAVFESELVNAGYEIDSLKVGFDINGLALVSINEKNLNVRFALNTTNKYDGELHLERSFTKEGKKHYVFKSKASQRFVVMQEELFKHGIKSVNRGAKVDMSIHYLPGQKGNSRAQWLIDKCQSICLSKKQDGNTCHFSGVLTSEWKAYNQTMDSPYGNMLRNNDNNAFKNHAVVEVKSGKFELLAYIPAQLLIAKKEKEIPARTKVSGKATYHTLPLFHVNQQSWLVDEVTIEAPPKGQLDNQHDSRKLIKVVFASQNEARGDKCIYTFNATTDEQQYGFVDYHNQMKAISSPSGYIFTVEIKCSVKNPYITQIIKAERKS
jgi:hypothetical protein